MGRIKLLIVFKEVHLSSKFWYAILKGLEDIKLFKAF